MLKKAPLSVVVVLLVMAVVVPAAAVKPDRSHMQIEGGTRFYCDYDSDADEVWDYIILDRFWQDIQNTYFYDEAGNLVKIRTHWVWNNERSDPETGVTFKEHVAASDEIDPRSMPIVTEVARGNLGTLFIPGSQVNVRFHTAGRLVITWYYADPNDPSTWVPIDVQRTGVDRSGAVDLCSLFRQGHFVGAEPLPTAIKELQ